MSYILDALRKAEAERRMGAASDASVAPIFDAAQSGPRIVRRSSRWLWPVLAAAAGALVAAVWLEWSTTAPPPVRSVPTASTLPAPAPAPPPTPTVAPAAPVVLHRPPPAIEPTAETVQAERPANVIHDGAAPAIAKQAPADRASPQQPAASIATLRELPAEIQQQIPPLAISGYIYASNSADRSVLINQKLLREGDEVSPGLTLEKLLPKGMVLSYKGYRFRTGY
jgi:general secretion pathway protein B